MALLLWAAPALANTCFSQERDPRTRKPYESEALWQADVDALWAEAPPMPWIFDLLHGNQVAQSESKVRAGSDKRRHCYVGCRIANEAGYHVAVYAGYFKEDQDLKDCDPATSYEPKDLAATILGADLARENPGRADKDYCLKQCRSEF